MESEYNIIEIKDFVTDSDIIDLETFFKGVDLPKHVKLDGCVTIVYVEKFIDSHLSVIRTNKGNKTFKIYYDRLIKLKELLCINLVKH